MKKPMVYRSAEKRLLLETQVKNALLCSCDVLSRSLIGTSKIKVVRPLNPEYSHFASFSIKAKYSLRQSRAILLYFFRRDCL